MKVVCVHGWAALVAIHFRSIMLKTVKRSKETHLSGRPANNKLSMLISGISRFSHGGNCASGASCQLCTSRRQHCTEVFIMGSRATSINDVVLAVSICSAAVLDAGKVNVTVPFSASAACTGQCPSMPLLPELSRTTGQALLLSVVQSIQDQEALPLVSCNSAATLALLMISCWPAVHAVTVAVFDAAVVVCGACVSRCTG